MVFSFMRGLREFVKDVELAFYVGPNDSKLADTLIDEDD